MYGTSLPHISKKGDKYGFVDEREIRISTGIMLVLGLFALFLVVFKAEFQIALILVSVMVLDFILKVFLSPRLSLFGSFVRIFLQKKDAVWVGAVQKRFAWSIGLFLSGFVLFCILLLGEYLDIHNPPLDAMRQLIETNRMNGVLIPMTMNPAIIACVLCLIFMWSESVVGYCVGCSLYAWLVKKGWMKQYEGQNCTGGKCDI